MLLGREVIEVTRLNPRGFLQLELGTHSGPTLSLFAGPGGAVIDPLTTTPGASSIKSFQFLQFQNVKI